ncbi:glycoside hydrolase family 88 protein [Enterocloster lavalensis]|uniref:glycoside hydrolase family 88 protein n=1 Tax=Enterocloster lavalensis TaxID=460384 RepID=UPI002665B410|nr:glycoside hydrolase family 88 protein [Enterocloster lavalensis]
MERKIEALDQRYSGDISLSKSWVEEAIAEAAERTNRLLPRFTDRFPGASTQDGVYYPVEKVDWTEGFWTGILWLLYETVGDPCYRRAAEGFLPQFRERLEKRIKTNTHDLGFLYSLSCVAAYKLTGNRDARDTAECAARLLYERYNKTAKIIQAWGDLDDPEKQGRMIIDCNLNLPLLFWAGEETGTPEYVCAAQNHLKCAMEYLVREDSSTFHTYYMDVHTGRPVRGTTHQGYSDDSCWARGQAWAIYGFALNYRRYRNPELILTAKRTANYFLNRLPEDYVCYWDLIFTAENRQYRDTSAAAVAACGLLELIRELPLTDPDRRGYEHAVCRIMKSLREHDLAGCEDGLLLHGLYNYGRGMGIDEGNLWGDYFYLEALVRMERTWEPYW